MQPLGSFDQPAVLADLPAEAGGLRFDLDRKRVGNCGFHCALYAVLADEVPT
jgi:hypothetical protein